MRDPERIDRICDLLKVMWHKAPDLRLGQLLEVYVFDEHLCIFHQEDDITEERLRGMIE